MEGALNKYKASNPDDYALLLFEDNDFAKKIALLPDNIFMLTTRPFFQALKDRGYIHSVEKILKKVEVLSAMAGDDRKALNRKKRRRDECIVNS